MSKVSPWKRSCVEGHKELKKIVQEEMECKESCQKVVNHESESYPGDQE